MKTVSRQDIIDRYDETTALIHVENRTVKLVANIGNGVNGEGSVESPAVLAVQGVDITGFDGSLGTYLAEHNNAVSVPAEDPYCALEGLAENCDITYLIVSGETMPGSFSVLRDGYYIVSSGSADSLYTYRLFTRAENLKEEWARRGGALFLDYRILHPNRLDRLWYNGEIARIALKDNMKLTVYVEGKFAALLFDSCRPGSRLLAASMGTGVSFYDNMRRFLASDERLNIAKNAVYSTDRTAPDGIRLALSGHNRICLRNESGGAVYTHDRRSIFQALHPDSIENDRRIKEALGLNDF